MEMPEGRPGWGLLDQATVEVEIPETAVEKAAGKVDSAAVAAMEAVAADTRALALSKHPPDTNPTTATCSCYFPARRHDRCTMSFL